MAAMRCKLPEFGKEPNGCALPTEDPELKKAQGPDLARQAPLRHDARNLRPEDDGAVQRHPLLVGVRMSFTQREARGLIRKAVDRVPEGESIRHLNIMPMMDMMTILLVAFIFQMATSALELEAGTVELPRTDDRRAAAREGVDARHHADRHRRRGQVDRLGQQRRRRPVRKGRRQPRHQDPAPDRTSSRRCIRKRSSRCSDRASTRKAPPPELLIIADRTTPYRLLIEVMFSAKQKEAGYKHFRLIVQKNFPVKPPEVTGGRGRALSARPMRVGLGSPADGSRYTGAMKLVGERRALAAVVFAFYFAHLLDDRVLGRWSLSSTRRSSRSPACTASRSSRSSRATSGRAGTRSVSACTA